DRESDRRVFVGGEDQVSGFAILDLRFAIELQIANRKSNFGNCGESALRRLDRLVDRFIAVRQPDEPRFVLAGWKVDAVLKHGVEEGGEGIGVRGGGFREIRDFLAGISREKK